MIYEKNPLLGQEMVFPDSNPSFPEIPYFDEFIYKHYYITRDLQSWDTFHLYMFEYEPTGPRVDEQGYIIPSQKYGNPINRYRYTYRVGWNYWMESDEYLKPYHSYTNFVDTLIYNNFDINFERKQYKRNPLPNDQVVIPDLASLLPKIPNEDYNYKHYYICRNSRTSKEDYFLYLFRHEPVSISLVSDEYSDDRQYIMPLNKYGKEMLIRQYNYDLKSGGDEWAGGDELWNGINSYDESFADTIIYNNFIMDFGEQIYELNPMRDDGVLPALEPDFPDIPNEDAFKFKHYCVIQDKEYLDQYYLYLMSYEPAYVRVEEDYLVAYHENGLQIYNEKYSYMLGQDNKNWASSFDSSKLSYSSFKERLAYINFTMVVEGELYEESPIPDDGVVPVVINIPQIPNEGIFQYKHYFIVKDEKYPEYYHMYLFAYEPAALELKDGCIVAKQNYGKEINCLHYYCVIGRDNWVKSSSSNATTESCRYDSFDDRLVYNNFAMEIGGDYYRKNELLNDGVVPAVTSEFPRIPEITAEGSRFRYYFMYQSQTRLEEHYLYLLKERPVECQVKYGEVHFIDQENKIMDIRRCRYTIGTNAWEILGEQSRVSISDKFIEFCNFDINLSDSSSGDVIEAFTNPYPNDGIGIGAVRNGWTKVNGKYHYYENGIHKHGENGWLDIDGQTYYLRAVDNWSRVENSSVVSIRPSKSRSQNLYQRGNAYYFGAGGSMVTGKQEINGDVYLFDEYGRLEKVISGASVYRAKVDGDIRYKPNNNQSWYSYKKGERVVTVVPKEIEKNDGVDWILVSYSGRTGNKYGWVELSNLEEWTGTSYIFHVPDWKPMAEHDKKEIAEFFGYQKPDEQVKLIQLDESIQTDENGKTIESWEAFIQIWNALDDSQGIDSVTFMMHGNPTVLNTEHTTDVYTEGKNKGQKVQLTIVKLESFKDENNPTKIPTLDDKNISMVLLIACNTSQYGWNIIASDENTIARNFGKIYGVGNVVGATTQVKTEYPSIDNDNRYFYVVLNGRFVLYYKGAKGIEAKYCRQNKYLVSQVLNEVFD